MEGGPISLFLDFDGTLTEIASGPDAIEVPLNLGDRIEALTDRLNGGLALVSGRSIENLRQFLPSSGIFLAGSHGGHIVSPQGDVIREAKALPDHVGRMLRDFAHENGLLFEPKAHGAALHYRSNPDMEDKARSFAEGLANDHDLGTKNGKRVVEIVWPGVDKGGAVEALAKQTAFMKRTPIFIGDDITDEDGFIACNRLGGFGIQVGRRAPTAARYRLQTVEDVYAWLNL